MDFILGIIAGVISSSIFWLYKTHISPPKIDFGDCIAKRHYKDGSVGFHYIYKNTGERRIIDTSIKATIQIPGLAKRNIKLMQVLSFDTASHNRFVIGSNAISNKLTVDMDSFRRNKILVENIKIKLDSEVNIDTIFQLSPDSEITIKILGNDELTGLRKVFESPVYTRQSIIEGVFNRETLTVQES